MKSFVKNCHKCPIYYKIIILDRLQTQDKKRAINYAEFTQLLHDFHEEHAKEAFKSKDPNGTGYISPLDFLDIMISVKKHLLTHDVKDNLVAVSYFPTDFLFMKRKNSMEFD